MELKKLISSFLAVGILFNNSLILSASTLSEDGRYEIFEGNNITIDNVLEEDKVDIEIEGNTLVNSLNYNSSNDFSWLDGTINEDGYIEIEADGSTYKNFFVKKEALIVKPSTTYTFFIEIIENTLTKVIDTSAFGFIFGASHEANMTSLWTGNKSFSYDTKPGIYKFTLTTKDIFDDVVVGDRGFVNRGYSGKFKFRYMIVEGNHADKNIAFFRGVKSVGESAVGVSIASESDAYQYYKMSLDSTRFNYYLKNVIESGTKITNKSDKVVVLLHYNKGTEYWIKDVALQPNESYVVEDGLDIKIVTFYTFNDWNIDNIPEYLSNVIEISNGYSNETDTKLQEPLRGLPNGVKDRVIKRNGQWMIERNCGEVILDGSEDYQIYQNGVNDEYMCFNSIKNYGAKKYSDILTNRFLRDINIWEYTSNNEGLYVGNTNHVIFIKILKSKLDTLDSNGLKKWLNRNNVNIVYELETPKYESLNIGLTLKLYQKTTHITNNSNIPANMKVTVDRAANRAKEAIELAKTSPTRENLASARMWANLLKESILKDELQSEINNITNIEDLQLEKKTVTANMDLYVKSENTLSMSLDTNSITFEGYSGVSDMEKLSAVSINVNSSLPYSLNAYMPNEFSNSDGSNKMPTNLLNIRESSQGEYKRFADTSEKLILKDDCEAGNDIVHKIDLKLSSTDAHKTDVYKTVIKFEAEQK